MTYKASIPPDIRQPERVLAEIKSNDGGSVRFIRGSDASIVIIEVELADGRKSRGEKPWSDVAGWTDRTDCIGMAATAMLLGLNEKIVVEHGEV